MVVSIYSVQSLHKDRNEDHIIQHEPSSAAGLLCPKYGHFTALASAALHTDNHIVAVVLAVPAPAKSRADPACLKSNNEGDEEVPAASAAPT